MKTRAPVQEAPSDMRTLEYLRYSFGRTLPVSGSQPPSLGSVNEPAPAQQAHRPESCSALFS